jgi:hypothetical protein
VGVGTTSVLATLSVGSNVIVNDHISNKLTVSGNVYVSNKLKVIDEVDTYLVKAALFKMKVIDVVAEQPDYNRALL